MNFNNIVTPAAGIVSSFAGRVAHVIPMSFGSSDNNYNTLLRPGEQAGELLPEGYEPTELDVCCGRGKRNWNHAGNVAFRTLIHRSTDAYMKAGSKVDKSAMICNIVESMRSKGCKFINQETTSGRWFDIGDAPAREKVAHSLRDQVTAINRQTKKSRQEFDPTPNTHVRRPSITHSDSGHEAGLRRMSLDSTAMYQAFARRPSWVAAEGTNLIQQAESMEGVVVSVPNVDSPIERRPSSWEYFDNYVDHCMENEIEPPLSNEMDDQMAIVSEDQRASDWAFVSEGHSVGRVSEDQLHEPLDRSALLRGSMHSWDPRVSMGSESILSVHRSAFSSGTTLRRTSNSLKISNISVQALLDGVEDFNASGLSSKYCDMINE